jgi:hypothetical protein
MNLPAKTSDTSEVNNVVNFNEAVKQIAQARPVLGLKDLPEWVRKNIEQQQAPYFEYFEAKWGEVEHTIELPLTVTPIEKNLPDEALRFVDAVPDGGYSKFLLEDGTRLISLATPAGPVGIYEIEHETEVPLNEKGDKAVVILKHLKLYAPEVFWKAGLLVLDQRGGINLVTFLYLFGLADQKLDKQARNANNIANRLELLSTEINRRASERFGGSESQAADATLIND